MKNLPLKKLNLILSFCLISLFISAQNQDCITAQQVLTKDTIFVNELMGIGNENENYDNLCFPNNSFSLENESYWLFFDVVESGTMTFTATPFETGDLDFYLFKAENSTFCDSLESYICNAASCGSNGGQTGMSSSDDDPFEDLNCDEGENNFSMEGNLEVGTRYYLLIDNFAAFGGYYITFCGTALFSVDDVACSGTSNTSEISSEQFTISPNPSHGQFFIEEFDKIQEIEVINLQGIIIQKITSVKSSINIEHEPGVYYLKMKLKDGKTAIKSVVIF